MLAAINKRTMINALTVEMSAVDAEAAAGTAKIVVVAAAMTVVAIDRIAAIVAPEMAVTLLIETTTKTTINSTLISWARRSHHSNSKFTCSSEA